MLHTLDRKGPLRLTDLTARVLKQPSALTSLVARLERDGLVSRRRDPRVHGRAVLISLTRAGRRLLRPGTRSAVRSWRAWRNSWTTGSVRRWPAARPSWPG